MKKVYSILPFLILLLVVLGCEKGGIKSGRLEYVEDVRTGSVGSHGSQGKYVKSRHLYVNDKEYFPDEIKMEDIDGCAASPNPAVEAFKCYSFHNPEIKQYSYVLRMKDDQPDWMMIPEKSDIWVGDGHWLLFKDFFFNVETFEQKKIKGLPERPEKYFMATSPDLETIIYEEDSFFSRYDLSSDEPSLKAEKEKQWKLNKQHRENGIAAFWVIDISTGKVKIIELPKDKYDWANSQKYSYRMEWLRDFQKNIVWEKDKAGKDQLVYPK